MATHYELAPSTRMLWRSADRVQFEVGERAVVVDGLPTRTARALISARELPPDPAAVTALEHLARAGLVWPRADADDGRHSPPAPRLAPELAALSARFGIRAAEVLNARRQASVAVHGVGRVGPHLGAVLAASGVGNIHFLATTDVKLHQAVPGGVQPEDESQRLAVAARAAVKRAAPGTDVRVPSDDDDPDLVILAVDEPLDDDRREALHARGLPHLPVALGPAGAVIGPLVLPGLTSCLRCADLHRTDRDAAWPRLAVQLTIRRRYGPASEVAVATIATGVAAMQALAFLDGAESACLDGTLELHPPDWRLRRRSRPVHPRCGCSRSA
jgi:hypothetical protein